MFGGCWWLVLVWLCWFIVLCCYFVVLGIGVCWVGCGMLDDSWFVLVVGGLGGCWSWWCGYFGWYRCRGGICSS